VEGAAAPSVKFLDKSIPLYAIDRGWEGIVPIPYLQPSGEARIEVSAPGAAPISLPVLVKQNVYKSEKLTVQPGKVKPKKKDLERIKKEGGLIKRVYRTLTPKKYWTGNFVLPVQSEFTSPYGTKRIYNGMMTGSHQGVDLRAPTGTPIYAPAPGRVAFVYNMFLTGHTVVLDHGYGLFTVYAHLSRTDVREGQEIPTQHQLGLAGATGRVSGPHLHWGAIIHDVKVNPQALLQGMR
jgi:murein DD-endopeptidase MepM/ murein hydrolase activator NlpD